MEPTDSKDRYAGRPLLILLENYVLAVIDRLPAGHGEKVSAAVVRHFGGPPSEWMATIRRVSGLPGDFDERIRALWATQQPGVNPLDFAIAVADASFVGLIDPT